MPQNDRAGRAGARCVRRASMSAVLRTLGVFGLGLLVANCAAGKVDEAALDLGTQESTAETPGGVYKVGKPYTVAGRRFEPKHQPDYDEVGLASWYGPGFHGRRTANGETFDQNAFSAAHPTLPLPAYARVTNLSNGRSVMVRINDRGPFSRNRVIDLSQRTADALNFRRNGTAKVRVQFVGLAPLRSDDDWLSGTLRQTEAADQLLHVDRALAQKALEVERGGELTLILTSLAGEVYGAGDLPAAEIPLPQPRAVTLADLLTIAPGFAPADRSGLPRSVRAGFFAR